MQAEAKARNSTGQIDPPHLKFEAAMAETPKLRHRRGKMNRTEMAFHSRLSADFQGPDFKFEALTLRWGGTNKDADMRYTADFVVFTEPKWTLIECKGAHERSRDVVRFRGCRAEWQHRFNFEYWMLKKGTWTRLE